MIPASDTAHDIQSNVVSDLYLPGLQNDVMSDLHVHSTKTSIADDISLMSSPVQQFQRPRERVAVDIHRMSSPGNSHFQTSMFMPTPAQLLRLHSVVSNTIQILVFLLRHVESGSLSFFNINDKSYCIPILAWFNLRVVCTRHCALTTRVESRLLLHCCMIRILFVSSTAPPRAQSTILRHTCLLT